VAGGVPRGHLLPVKGWFVVANTSAGRRTDEVVEEVATVLGAAAPVEIAAVDDLGALDEALERVRDRTVVVAGGDGSIHQIVQRLWDGGRLAEAVVGVVAMGTCNDFANGLGLPLDPVAGARRLLDASPQQLDLMVAENGSVVTNAVHIGLGARVLPIAARLKNRFGTLAFPIGAAVTAIRQRAWRLQVTVDGRPLVPQNARVLVAAAANLPTIGGGIPLCPTARADDGRLDVMVAVDHGRIARLSFGVALRTGRHVDRADVLTATGTEVRVAGEPAGHDADGEVVEGVTDRTYRVVPAAWRVLL